MLKFDTTQKRRRRERKEEAAWPDGKSQQMIRLGQNVECLGRDVTGTAEWCCSLSCPHILTCFTYMLVIIIMMYSIMCCFFKLEQIAHYKPKNKTQSKQTSASTHTHMYTRMHARMHTHTHTHTHRVNSTQVNTPSGNQSVRGMNRPSRQMRNLFFHTKLLSLFWNRDGIKI